MPQKMRLFSWTFSIMVVDLCMSVCPKICFVNHQVSVHSIRLPKNSTVGDVLNDIKTKVSIYYSLFFI